MPASRIYWFWILLTAIGIIWAASQLSDFAATALNQIFK